MQQHIETRTEPFEAIDCRAAAERRSNEGEYDRADVDSVIGCLTAAMFGEVMRSLRSALALR